MSAAAGSASDAAILAALRADNARLREELSTRDHETELARQQMARVLGDLGGLHDLVPGILLELDPALHISRANGEALRLLGLETAALAALPLTRLLPAAPALLAPFTDGRLRGPIHEEVCFARPDGSELPVLLSASAQYDTDGELQSLLLVGLDLRERRRLEMELRHAQKMESLGQLAAGIAHEINTPMQFIGDNLHFIGEACAELLAVVDGARTRESVDLAFLRNRLPRAVDRAREGVGRVGAIVGAMRMFAHPGHGQERVDVNAVVENAVSVATHCFKYVADLELSLGSVPEVPGVRGDLGQVVLNLITNAAHAIEARLAGEPGRGRLRIATREAPERAVVEIEVEDDGCGIPEAIAHRVYDPFFTTKPLGSGTGQGLALARTIVVDRHGGELAFDRLQPHGTRFVVRLPRDGRPREVAA